VYESIVKIMKEDEEVELEYDHTLDENILVIKIEGY